MTPLHYAAQGGSLETVKWLIGEQQCNLASLDNQKVTPLHLAAYCGHLQIIKYSIEEKHCDPHCTNEDNTPLHVAVMGGQLQTVQHLIVPSVQQTLGTVLTRHR